jgi:transketolase
MPQLQRDVFGECLVQQGHELPELVVLDADNSTATRTALFGEVFPSRFINVGVAEQNLVGVAAGLALSGLKPLASTFSIFLCGRAFEIIRNGIALNGLPVTLVGTHAGVSVGRDGPTHFAIEDIALMRSLPGMRVVVPADSIQVRQLLPQILRSSGPTYLRLSRWGLPDVTSGDIPFELGKGHLLRKGSGVCIIATGLMTFYAIQAQRLLVDRGVNCGVAAIHTIKPLDEDFLLQLSRDYDSFVVTEEHSRIGGLFSAVAEFFATQSPRVCIPICINDSFGHGGSEEEIFGALGLTAQNIYDAALRAIAVVK